MSHAIRFFTPPYHKVHALIALALIAGFWFGYIVHFHLLSYYSPGQVEYFQRMKPWELWKLVDDGKFARFSPLAFAPIGYVDMHVLVPLMGFAGQSSTELAHGTRTVWFHPIFAIAVCAVAASVAWRLFLDARLVGLAILLMGLADTIAFETRYPPLLGFYLIHICTFMAAYCYVQLAQRPSMENGYWLALYTLLPLGMWEQGLDLPIAISAALAVTLCTTYAGQKRSELPQMRALFVIVIVSAIYLVLRIPSGMSETVGVREDAFFFNYHHPLAMLDDLLLNISALSMQAWRQFLPYPPLGFSVLANIDMTKLNEYNALYAQYPDMPYRMMGLWYSGISFACTIALVIYSWRLALRKQGWERALLSVAISILLFGCATHLPIQHRDYFYLPNFELGYKICVSYVGFVLLLLMAAREFLNGTWFQSLPYRRQAWLLTGFTLYFCFAAVTRAALEQTVPKFPW